MIFQGKQLLRKTILLFFLCFASQINANSRIPFQSGEKLEYSIKWGFFPVGTAVLEVLPMNEFEDQPCHVVSFRVRTNSFADKIYKIRTEIKSILDADFNRTLQYEKKQREGSTSRDIKVKYDYQKLISVCEEKNSNPIILPIPLQVLDPLAIAYFFRIGELYPGQIKKLPTSDGKKLKDIKVTIGERTRIRVPAGRYYAFETIPEMQNLSGVFKKSPDGILKVWYSDDEKKYPLRISSKVVVGSFTASLEKITSSK